MGGGGCQVGYRASSAIAHYSTPNPLNVAAVIFVKDYNDKHHKSSKSRVSAGAFRGTTQPR